MFELRSCIQFVVMIPVKFLQALTWAYTGLLGSAGHHHLLGHLLAIVLTGAIYRLARVDGLHRVTG